MGKKRRRGGEMVQKAPPEERRDEGKEKPIFVKYLPLIILGIIVLLATYFRAYHLSYPVIGYHNWKETHYLTEARNFAREGFFAHGIFVPAEDLPFLRADPSGAHPDTFPATSIIVGIFFKIFGPSLAVARVINLLFGLGVVVAFYAVMKKLFHREDIALMTAFLAAINPMFIYFSHNVMLDNPGLFFMLLALIFYLDWIKSGKGRDALLTAAFLSLSILTKYSFAIIVIPMLFIFPWTRLKDVLKRRKVYLPCLLILLLVPLWMFYSTKVLPKEFNAPIEGNFIYYNLKTAFSAQTWDILKNYAAENFGGFGNFPIGIVLAIAGLIAFIMMVSKKGALKKDSNRFLLGYIIGFVPWFLILSEKLIGHSYHQYPVAPLLLMLNAFLFVFIAVNIESLVKFNNTRYIILVLFIPLVIIPSVQSKDRLFDTQFYGLDVAGEYIKAHSQPDETIFHSSGQNYGVLWHADRKGYRPPGNLDDFAFGENERNVKWVFMYQWGISQYLQNQDLANHIAENYHLAQIGLQQDAGQWRPFYFVFQKGGTTNFSDLNAIAQGHPISKRIYDTTKGKVEIGFIDID